MAPRLRMTSADYVAIAVSPALIMALVGSLVFYLIEVLYVGDYELRLNYVFGLFVFATVLIGRIAIEFGAERAAAFSLPLGTITFLALMRFVEHSSPWSWLINLALLAVVWWSAHKLVWNCTLIDDNEDASGEGLLDREQRVTAPGAGDHENELLGGREAADASRAWWRRLFAGGSRSHAPGASVLYFSLAALPLFGLGQRWIPPDDVARRRYAFGLLAVYVAAALCLLVTTSFLGLRRYLRQRSVEMPTSMAATWVALGGAQVALVMLLAALVPRPGAEYALSRPPWVATSPGELEPSPQSVGDETADAAATGEAGQGEAAPSGSGPSDEADAAAASHSPPSNGAVEQDSAPSGELTDAVDAPTEPASADSSQAAASPPPRAGEAAAEADPQIPAAEPSDAGAAAPRDDDASPARADSSPAAASPSEMLHSLSSSVSNVLKLLFYVVLAAALAYVGWKNRQAIARSLAEIWRDIRALLARLFGRAGGEHEAAADSAARPRRRSFAQFADPFASGRHQQLPPAELVRYTFEAFEAWAGDRGRARTPDQTPQELVRSILPPNSPMYAEARHMTALYSEAAYARGTITRERAASLAPLWNMMRAAPTRREPTPSPTSPQPGD